MSKKDEPAPIPEEGKWVHSKEIKDIFRFYSAVVLAGAFGSQNTGSFR